MSVEDTLIEVINENIDHDAGTLTADTSLDSLGLDSLDYVVIQVEVRKSTGFTLDFDELKQAEPETIGDLSIFIENLRKNSVG